MKKIKTLASRVSEALLGLSISLYFTIANAIPMFADGEGAGIFDSSSIEEGIQHGSDAMVDLLKSIATPVIIVIAAIAGFQLLVGDERTMQKSKATLLRVILGVGIIYGAVAIGRTLVGWFE